jgi:hypothetical protein
VLNGHTANIGLGRNGNGGELFLKNDNGDNAIVLRGTSGQLFLKDSDGDDTIVLEGSNGNIGLGKDGRAGNLFVKDDAGHNTIHMSGGTGNINLEGDIRFTNLQGDCAEEFDVAGVDAPDPGTVMVIREGGSLTRSTIDYDRCVAGVISGAGELRPGIILGKQEGQQGRLPLALVGKVYCKVDAQYGKINVGDLLTTSPTPGHAMKVSDPARAFGAVIGKALCSWEAGLGLIPILIALQ